MDRWMDAWIDEGESEKRYIIYIGHYRPMAYGIVWVIMGQLSM